MADILSLLDYQVDTVDCLLLEECHLYDAALVEVADYSRRQPNNKVVITSLCKYNNQSRGGIRINRQFSESIAIMHISY